MDVKETERREENMDLLVFLLSAQPREGWEEIFEAARMREAARIFGLEQEHEEPGDDA